MKTKRMISTILALVFVFGLFPAGLLTTASAAPVTFTVEPHNNSFTVSRSSVGTTQTVIVRTVDQTAVAGVHYVGVYRTLTFGPTDWSLNVTVTERPSLSITNIVDQYQTGTVRSYRFEVLDNDGFELASCSRNITYDSAYSFNDEYIMTNDGEHLIYLVTNGDHNTNGTNINAFDGVPGTPYVDVSFPGTSSFTTISDQTGNGYEKNGVWTASTDALFSRSSCAPRDYLAAVGDKMYAAIAFTGTEVDDGYQYIQILADNAATCDSYDSNGSVNAPSVSLYKACFELNKMSGGVIGGREYCEIFPTLYLTQADYPGNIYYEINDYGKVHDQKFKSNVYKAANTGALVLDPTVNNISVRLNARGGGDDDWKFKNMFARLALVDLQAPTALRAAVSQGPNQKHNKVTVTVAFSEIVRPLGDVVLHTTWGDLTAPNMNSSTYTNVIPFNGVITANSGTQLRITGIEGSVKDLHGNSLSGNISQDTNYSVGVKTAPPVSNGSYVLSTAADLVWFADQLTTNSALSAVLANDIDMSFTQNETFAPLAPGGFAGVFDGQGHTIDNLNMTQQGSSPTGLFARILRPGAVRDLTLGSGCSVTASTPADVGGIAGQNAGTIEKCVVAGDVSTSNTGRDGSGKAIGGICGVNSGTVRNCLVGEAPIASDLYNRWNNLTVGGVVGRNSGTLTGCMFYGLYNEYSRNNITRGSVCGANTGTVTNCAGVHHNSNYMDGAIGADSGTSENVTFPETGAFSSGAVCWQINCGVTDGSQAWYQTIGTDSLPKFAGGTVYQHGSLYQNAIAHVWGQQSYEWHFDPNTMRYTCSGTATCSVCGETYTAVAAPITMETWANNSEVWIAKFSGQSAEYGFVYQSKEIDLNSLGHDLEFVEGYAGDCTTGYGWNDYYRCRDCGKYFLDKYGEVELDYDTDIVFPVRHDFVVVDAVPPTCGEDGWEWHFECTRCGICSTTSDLQGEEEREYFRLPATGLHDATHHNAIPPTCDEPGTVEYWQCDVCGKFFSDEGCQNEVGFEDVVVYGGHDFVAVDAVPPTCVEDGWEWHFECTRCGICSTTSDLQGEEEREFFRLPATGVHDATHHSASDATCDQNGSIEYWQCDVCGKCFSDEDCQNEIDYADTVVPALGHDWGDPVCTFDETNNTLTASFTCKRDPSHIGTVSTSNVNISAGATVVFDGEEYEVPFGALCVGSTMINFTESFVSYTFTPETSGGYHFYSLGNKDTVIQIYDGNGSRIAYSDDGIRGRNFNCVAYLEGQSTYSVKLRSYASSTGWAQVCVEQSVLHAVDADANIDHGSLTFKDPSNANVITEAFSGAAAAVYYEPDEGYGIASLTVTTASGKSVELIDRGGYYVFIMPDEDVTVNAHFARTFNVSLASLDGFSPDEVEFYINGICIGDFDGLESYTASEGAEVMISVVLDYGEDAEFTVNTETPAAGYGKDSDGDRTLTFTMPSEDVTLTVTAKSAVCSALSVGDNTVSGGYYEFFPEVTGRYSFSLVDFENSYATIHDANDDYITSLYNGSAQNILYAGEKYILWFNLGSETTFRITLDEELPVCSVGIAEYEHGTVTLNHEVSVAGEAVAIYATPYAGYTLASVTVENEYGSEVPVEAWGSEFEFLMPDCDVTVTVTFERLYPVTVETPAGVSRFWILKNLSTTDSREFTAGTELIVNLDTIMGYELDGVTVTAADGTNVDYTRDNQRIAFTMPAGSVTVTPSVSKEALPTLTLGENAIPDKEAGSYSYFSFTPAEGGYYTFTYSGYYGAEVYDPNGDMLDSPYDGEMLLGGADYIVEILHYQNESGETLTISADQLLPVYTVSVISDGGTVTVSPAFAPANNWIAIEIWGDPCHEFDDVSAVVTSGENVGSEVNVVYNFDEDGTYYYDMVMPDGDVEVTVAFVLNDNGRAVQAVIDAIDAIGTVTLASLDDILAAESAYAALDDEVKPYVTNLWTLVEAHDAYDALAAAPAILWGDVNGDGIISGKDATLILQYVANYDDETGESTVVMANAAAADVNCDGSLTGKDAALIKQYVANYDDVSGESTVILGPHE